MKSLHQRNMKYKLVIFDFDGTIADTSSGILDSHRYALQAMGRDVPSESELRKVIGGNLLRTYIDVFDFEEEKAREAVKIYRERYAKEGIHMATLYPGVSNLLQNLKEAGLKIGVATLKAEKFAEVMLVEFGISELFDSVCGMDENDGLSKAGLIKKCCSQCGISEDNAILIGDSNNDFIGAQTAGVGFLGVTYGFGFKKKEKYVFDTVDTLQDVIKLCVYRL